MQHDTPIVQNHARQRGMHFPLPHAAAQTDIAPEKPLFHRP
jgi:hypothetical protein